MNTSQLRHIAKSTPKSFTHVDKFNCILEIDNDLQVKLDRKEFIPILKILTEEIETRPNPLHRIEYWECVDKHGNYNDGQARYLLNKRRKNKTKKKQVNERAMQELCKRFNQPRYMGELLLSEIKLGGSEKEKEIVSLLEL